jgi:hypothetical protein
MRSIRPRAAASLALLCLLALATPTPATTPARLSADALRADVAVLRRAYEALHPGLYRYNTKAEMDRRFARLEADLGREQTLAEAYLTVSVFLNTIRCGHTYANFFNQSDEVADALFKGTDRVPFHFRWIDRRMIVTRNLSSDARLKPGAEVLAIDGVRSGEILRRLMTVARADGSNDDKRLSYLGIYGDAEYEAFDVFPVNGSRIV